MRARTVPSPAVRPRGAMRAACGLALALAPAAFAADDVVLSAMASQGNIASVDRVQVSADYAQLIREVGALVGTPAIAPPATTGTRGFEVTVEGGVGMIDTYGAREREVFGRPSPWARAQASGEAPAIAWSPGIGIRKGLPFSTEVWLAGRWLGASRQGAIGGGIRAALLEGRRGWPDLGVHLGYHGYVGNRELRLGVLEAGVSLGGTVVPTRDGAGRTRLQPYVDVSLLSITAAPLLDAATATTIGAVAYGRRSSDPDAIPTARAQTLPRFTAGLQFDGPRFLVRFTGGFTLNAIPHAGVAIGFRG